MLSWHAVPSCHAVTRDKSINVHYKNKVWWVCRTQPLMPSIRRVVTPRARTSYNNVIIMVVLRQRFKEAIAPMPPKATTFASCLVPTCGLGGGCGGGGGYLTSRHFFQQFEVSFAHTKGKIYVAPSPLSLRCLQPSLVEKSSK